MNSLLDLEQLSKYAGQRLDWIQAGGGNTSIKLKESMFVKASGWSLSEVTSKQGYVEIKYEEIRHFLKTANLNTLTKEQKEEAGKTCLANAALSPGAPSIETYLHASLGPVVLHTHPWVVTAIACRPDWENLIDNILPFLCVKVPYYTPGIELGIALSEKCALFEAQHNRKPSCIILQNHGLIISGHTVEEVLAETEQVSDTLAHYLATNISHYKASGPIQKSWYELTQNLMTVYWVQHPVVQEALTDFPHRLNSPVMFPDQVVFGGFYCLNIESPDNLQPVINYQKKYGIWPRLIRYNTAVYAIAPTLKKAKEIEDVLVCHLMTLSLGGSLQPLPKEELNYLVHWEAEKLRQNL